WSPASMVARRRTSASGCCRRCRPRLHSRRYGSPEREATPRNEPGRAPFYRLRDVLSQRTTPMRLLTLGVIATATAIALAPAAAKSKKHHRVYPQQYSETYGGWNGGSG